MRGYGVGGPAGVDAWFGPLPTTAHIAGGVEIQIAGPAGVGTELGFFDYIAVSSVTGLVRP